MTRNVKPAWRVGRLLLQALVGGVAVINVILVAKSIAELIGGAEPIDWYTLVESGRRIQAGDALYTLGNGYLFRWSPLAAMLMIGLAPLGVVGWQIAHLAAVVTLRRLALVALVLVSWPFWADLGNGNIATFVFVLGVFALRGSDRAALGYVAVWLLAPRPVATPLLAWLLWKRPGLRLPFAGMLLISAVLVLATGWAGAWVHILVASGSEIGNAYNIGPSRLIGLLWMPVGVVLGVVLTYRSHPGWASLVISPYLFPQYLLFGFWELEMDRVRPGAAAASSRVLDRRGANAAGSDR